MKREFFLAELEKIGVSASFRRNWEDTHILTIHLTQVSSDAVAGVLHATAHTIEQSGGEASLSVHGCRIGVWGSRGTSAGVTVFHSSWGEDAGLEEILEFVLKVKTLSSSEARDFENIHLDIFDKEKAFHKEAYLQCRKDKAEKKILTQLDYIKMFGEYAFPKL